MATQTLYKSPDSFNGRELDQVVISKPTVIGLESNYESLLNRTYFPLLSEHFSHWKIDCIPYNYNVESDITDKLVNFREKVPHYARYLLVPQISSKMPDEGFADVIVEYRLFDIATGELLIYTQFDSTWGVQADDGQVPAIWIYPSSNGTEMVQHETHPHFDDIVYVGKAMINGLREIESNFSLNTLTIHE